MNKRTTGAVALFMCASMILFVTVLHSLNGKPKPTTQKQQLIDCIESTSGTDAECDSCFYIVHHVKPTR